MVRGPPKKPMNEGPFVHWHRKITYLYYSTGGKDMVTITFSGDAEEVLLEMQRLVNMKKVEETPKKEAKKVTKAPNEEPKKETPKLKEAPKPEEPKQGEPKKEEPKKVEEAPKPKGTPKPEEPKQEVKKEASKEEPKQDDTGDAPMTEEQMAELRTLCMSYCKKVPDGKERIKQLLKGKGCARVTDLKQKDIPEFKALVRS